MTRFNTGDRIRVVHSFGWDTKVGELATVGDPAYIVRNHGEYLNVVWDKTNHTNRVDGGFFIKNFELARKFEPGDRVRRILEQNLIGTVVRYENAYPNSRIYVTVNWDNTNIDDQGWGEGQLEKIVASVEDKVNLILETAVDEALDKARTQLLDSLRTELNTTLNLNLGA